MALRVPLKPLQYIIPGRRNNALAWDMYFTVEVFNGVHDVIVNLRELTGQNSIIFSTVEDTKQVSEDFLARAWSCEAGHSRSSKLESFYFGTQ